MSECKPRVDDKRVIIIQVLKSGGRWIDAPEVYRSRKNRFVRWAGEGRMGRYIPRTRNGRWTSCAGPDRWLGREGTSMRIWRQRMARPGASDDWMTT